MPSYISRSAPECICVEEGISEYIIMVYVFLTQLRFVKETLILHLMDVEFQYYYRLFHLLYITKNKHDITNIN